MSTEEHRAFTTFFELSLSPHTHTHTHLELRGLRLFTQLPDREVVEPLLLRHGDSCSRVERSTSAQSIQSAFERARSDIAAPLSTLNIHRASLLLTLQVPQRIGTDFFKALHLLSESLPLCSQSARRRVRTPPHTRKLCVVQAHHYLQASASCSIIPLSSHKRRLRRGGVGVEE